MFNFTNLAPLLSNFFQLAKKFQLGSCSTKDLSGPMDLNYIPDNLSDPKNVCIPQDLYPWGLQFDPLPPPIGLTCIFPPPTTLHF